MQCRTTQSLSFDFGILRLSAVSRLVPGPVCAAVGQFPEDLKNTQVSLSRYSGAERTSEYASLTTIEQTRKRGEIMLDRMSTYGIGYSNFESRLPIDGNLVSAGGDLIGLTPAGLTATTGVVRTEAVINTDLYYQRAIFWHEAGKASPLHDDQIAYAVAHERSGTLPT